jgi:signal transduction histidine kinase
MEDEVHYSSPADADCALRLLLVDDQPIVAEALRRMLQDQPDIICRCITAPDEAIGAARDLRPTIILQDLVMPQLDGFDMLRAYRADDTLRDIPVVVLSASEDPDLKARAFASGANDYLVKWPNKVELLARIRHLSSAYLHRQQRDAAFAALRESERKLADANAELQRMARLKDEFITTVSHELRTPLTSIRGSLTLLAAGATGEVSSSGKKLLDIANQNCERLVRMIGDLLDIEKIESGNVRFELALLLEQAVEATRGYASQYRVPLELRGEADGIMVTVDRDRLIQVIINLLSNAIKFSPPDGPVALAVSCVPGHVRLSVTDRGPGIPEDFRSRIFQKFAQADSCDVHSRGGSGLGLSICKNIVEQHRGRIGFRDAPGGGTEFHVDLPV